MASEDAGCLQAIAAKRKIQAIFLISLQNCCVSTNV
jgi:hypothetical protein